VPDRVRDRGPVPEKQRARTPAASGERPRTRPLRADRRCFPHTRVRRGPAGTQNRAAPSPLLKAGARRRVQRPSYDTAQIRLAGPGIVQGDCAERALVDILAVPLFARGVETKLLIKMLGPVVVGRGGEIDLAAAVLALHLAQNELERLGAVAVVLVAAVDHKAAQLIELPLLVIAVHGEADDRFIRFDGLDRPAVFKFGLHDRPRVGVDELLVERVRFVFVGGEFQDGFPVFLVDVD